MALDQELLRAIDDYLAENYLPEQTESKIMEAPRLMEAPLEAPYLPTIPYKELDEHLNHLAPTFSERLLKLIDASGKKDAEIYKAADVDRKVFSKIRSNVNYHPRKKTAIAFCLALELSLDETEELLNSAGYSLNESSKFDLVLSVLISRGLYQLLTVNEALDYYTGETLRPVRN